MSATEVVANMPLHSATVRVNKHKADWRGWKFMWPFALVFVFVFVIPILYAVYISFFQKQMIGGTKFVGVNNYIRLFHDPQFWVRYGAWPCSPWCRFPSCCSCRRRWLWPWIP